MAGGIGSRFWPMSVEEHPKQFMDVLGIGKTLIQLTYERLRLVVPDENIYVITNEKYVELTKKELPTLKPYQILAESQRKNTAPCIAYASAKIYAENKDATLIVAPSDHLIIKEHRFVRIINRALEHANGTDNLLTLGIKPTRPDSGFGYIQFHQDGDILPGQIYKVKQFTEKPNREMAEIFLKSGDYYWNSGVFVWKASTILKAMQKLTPEIYSLFCSDFAVFNSPREKEFIDKAFRECENISIDFAVMENAKNVDVVLANFGWSDLGTWGSLYDHLATDFSGNSVRGNDVHVFNSSNCLINLPDGKQAIIQGLDNHIVVESDGQLLILNMRDEQNLKTYLKVINDQD